MSSIADNPSLIGNFLARLPDAVASLSHAASAPLPSAAIQSLTSRKTRPTEILEAFSTERSTANGFWRVALAALIHAHDQHIHLPSLPEELPEHYSALLKSAKESQPQVFERPDYLLYCFKLFLKFASQPDESSEDESDAQSGPVRSAPRSVSRSGGLPSIRYTEEGYASACTTYSLIDDDGEVFLSEELAVEDLLFIAHSAISSASRSLLAARQVVRDGQLYRHLDDASLNERADAMKDELEGLIEDLLALPTGNQAEPQ